MARFLAAVLLLGLTGCATCPPGKHLDGVWWEQGRICVRDTK